MKKGEMKYATLCRQGHNESSGHVTESVKPSLVQCVKTHREELSPSDPPVEAVVGVTKTSW